MRARLEVPPGNVHCHCVALALGLDGGVAEEAAKVGLHLLQGVLLDLDEVLHACAHIQTSIRA